LDYGPLEEHLLLCKNCQTRLMQVEEFVQVIRAALTELTTHPQTRFSAQSAYAL
jgi:exonuclease VII small subunit